MTGPEDVLEMVKKRWARPGGILAKLIPGNLHHVRASETIKNDLTKFPYATITLSDGEMLFSSATKETKGGDAIFGFEMEIKVYVSSTIPNVDAKAIRRELDETFKRDDVASFPISPPARVMDCVPQGAGSSLTLEEARNEGKDVAVVTRRWRLMIQGKI